MQDGSILEAYLNSKRINKQEFAKRLKMSKQNLYQLFKSKEMQPETKASLEAVIGLKWQEIEQAGKDLVNIAVNNARKGSFQANGTPDYRDEIISLLKEKSNSEARKTLQYLQVNNALLKTVVQALAKVQASLDKRKLKDVQAEMNNLVEQHLEALRKEGT